jgi:hypothetical protein
MKTYEIPQPPSSDAVRDENGNTYIRVDLAGGYWFNDDEPKVRGTYAWHELLRQRGPVRAL